MPDYLAQTDWRVSQRLSRELAAVARGEGLDTRKQAVPALHTCCRIVTEMAQMEAYRQRALYLDNTAAVAAYFAADWPDFSPTVQSLFQYKTDAARRREMVAGLQACEPERLQEIEALAQQTVTMWRQFVARGRIDNAQSIR